ncbi:MAG TPA: helix-turn-helix transcriptional regulator [Roseiarcus sp.]|nr:helix-turn-helix transcriptional regulator [Roseiarcus sp.]
MFADLGYSDAEERQAKLRLAYAINEIIASKRLSQTGAAARLGVRQPKVSALAHYKLDGFSVERLMAFLTALDRDVEITIKKKPRSRGGRVIVVAERPVGRGRRPRPNTLSGRALQASAPR